MSEQKVPAGWDEQRVKRLIVELDACATDMLTAVTRSYAYLMRQGLVEP